MSIFICPICGESLNRKNRIYTCISGHSYDIASEGYVHLLPANKKHSKLPGDDKNMVRARNRFLSDGYYGLLKNAIVSIVLGLASENTCVLDSGCGEGYYTESITRALKTVSKNLCVAGIDISKEAVRLAAKRISDAEFAVASAYHLPVCDESIDIILNCFSPLCESEFKRVLRKSAYFLYVVPAPRHLWEMKCTLYRNPYENERIYAQYEGFILERTEFIQDKIILHNKQAISDLFEMTPYLWKTPKEGVSRLKALERLETEVSFDIHIYRKL